MSDAGASKPGGYMPARIKIDGVQYDVDITNLDTEDGEFCATSLAIKVQADAPYETQRTILLHELVHACFEHAGSPPEPLTEEHVACLISRRLLPILRDNPDLVAYLTGA